MLYLHYCLIVTLYLNFFYCLVFKLDNKKNLKIKKIKHPLKELLQKLNLMGNCERYARALLPSLLFLVLRISHSFNRAQTMSYTFKLN